jgi:hypothetical protein
MGFYLGVNPINDLAASLAAFGAASAFLRADLLEIDLNPQIHLE